MHIFLLCSLLLLHIFLGINNTSKPGLWGGTVSTLEFKVNITQEMNGVVYTCQSANEALQRSVHEAATLDVLCKYIQCTESVHFWNSKH